MNIKLVIRSENGPCFVCDTRYTWWQTGFQLFNSSLPYGLKLYTEIQFKDKAMYTAFENGFNSMPDEEKEGVTICENSKANTINITWDY